MPSQLHRLKSPFPLTITHSFTVIFYKVVNRLVPIFYDSDRFGEAEPFLKIKLINCRNSKGAEDKETLALTGLLINSLLMVAKYR